MPTTLSFLAAFGVLLLALLAGIALLLVFGGLCALLEKRSSKAFCEGREHEKARLRDAAYWFSECDATYALIRALADPAGDLWSIRHTWRQAREDVDSERSAAIADPALTQTHTTTEATP